MDSPIINILTRTSGRPKGFKRALDSVQSQTYSKINHIIATDEKDSVDYLKESQVEFTFFNKNDFKDKVTPDDHLLLWKTRFAKSFRNGCVLPPNQGPPKRNQIDGHCHGVNSICKDKINWPSWNYGDFNVISNLYNTIEKKRWLDIIVVQKGEQGFGRRQDIL